MCYEEFTDTLLALKQEDLKTPTHVTCVCPKFRNLPKKFVKPYHYRFPYSLN